MSPARTARPWRSSLTGSAGESTSSIYADRSNRSFELAAAYEEAKASQEKATEASTANYSKKRSMAVEVKHFREQRDEIRQWEKLRDAKVGSPPLAVCGAADKGLRMRWFNDTCSGGCFTSPRKSTLLLARSRKRMTS